jgi:protein-S-isoprenylcysteine O-methyltransferase Ste14
MNKAITIISFIILAYVLPLSVNLHLLLTPQAIILCVISAILVLSQPAISIRGTKQQKSSDRFSVLIILSGCVLSQVFSITEWAYFRNDFREFYLDITGIIGIVLIIGGLVFRIWCIKTLGKYFTAEVQTKKGQKIISSGPYGVIRHPSYLGAYLTIIGGSVFLHAYFGILFSTVIMFTAYYYRISVEEKTLIREFGSEYTNYQVRTKKIFPFIY